MMRPIDLTARLPGTQAARYYAIVVGCYLLLWVGGPSGGTALYVAAAIWAFRGGFPAIQSLTVVWIVTLVNPAISAAADGSTSLRFVVIGASLIGVVHQLYRGRAKSITRPTLWLAGFCGTAAATSAVVSSFPDVSLFKVAGFFGGAVAVLLSTEVATRTGAPVEQWLRSVVVAVVALSFPLIVYDVGYFRNGEGFQGLLNHPQAFGVVAAISLAWLSAEAFFSRRRRPVELAVIGLALASLYASGARTAVVAVLGGFVLALAIRAHLFREIRRWRPFIVLATAAVVVVLAVDPVRVSIVSFVFKNQIDKVETVGAAFDASRGHLIERSIQGFLKHPVFGIGFGVPSEGDPFAVDRDAIFGIPVSAPIEKGFLVTAVLEETGLVGTVLFLIFLVSLLRRPALADTPVPLVGAFAALLTNVGEASLFSFGGIGMFVWLQLALFTSRNYRTRRLISRSPAPEIAFARYNGRRQYLSAQSLGTRDQPVELRPPQQRR